MNNLLATFCLHFTRTEPEMARRREDIFRACSEGDKDAVSRIISAGTDPRQVRNPHHYYRGETLLHTASRYVMFCMFTHLVYKT